MGDIRQFRILLVEDNEADIELTRVALRQNGSQAELLTAPDGAEALRQLRSGEVCPSLILMDLNAAPMDGRELLAELKSDRMHRHIPVIVISGSDAPDDIRLCYELQANMYVTKPFQFGDYRRLLQDMEDFWLNVAAVPAAARPRETAL